MRVSQQSMYGTMLSQMNMNLSEYMETNMQGSSQKRINRPSDDPAGTSRVLSYRSALERTGQYETNSDTALGWLNLADETLNNVSATVIRIRTLAEQAATESYTADQRVAIGAELRQLMGSLINLSNTEHEGKHIFAGQHYDSPAFVEGLSVSGTNLDGPLANMQVSGSLDRSAVVRFPVAGGTTPITIPPAAGDPPVDYEWTEDGGKTWNKGTISAPAAPTDPTSFDVGASRVTIPAGETMQVKPFDSNAEESKDNGSKLYIKPTAIYQGYDNKATATVDRYGSVVIPPQVGTTVTGTFNENVLIKFGSGVDWTQPNLDYSFSTDGGRTWTGGNKATITAGTPPDNTARLVVPGGFVDISGNAPMGDIPANGQLLIRPQRTALDFEIMAGQYLSVNNVGKDIFGGLYTTNGSDNKLPMFGPDDPRNLFETVGLLIAGCEGNDTGSIGKGLANLDTAHKNVLTKQAAVGGKENRIEVTLDNLDANKYDQTARLSAIEDVDFSELMIRFAKQQMAYQTVLKSSSMIMQLNLTKFM